MDIFLPPSSLPVISHVGDAPARILLVSIYPELAAQAQTIAKELNISLDIVEGGIHRNGHLYATEYQEKYDVIISQAGTALAIQQLVNKPVITIPITVQDYLHAFEEARHYSKKKFVFIGYEGDTYTDLKSLFHTIFKDTAQSYSYASREEFHSVLQKVLNFDKDFAIIGFGACVQQYSHDNDIPYILIRSDARRVREALLSAKNILDLHAKNKIRTRRLNSILNYSREGIIATDENAQITICNLAAKRMLKMSKQGLSRLCLTDSATPAVLRKLYGNGDFIFNELVVLNDKKYMVSRVPIHFRSQKHETVITFQALGYIQKVEARARVQLSAKGLVARYTFDAIVAQSSIMTKRISLAQKYSSTQASVLIEGETGTGKELFAQSIHNASPRKHGPFVAINCAALPENLLESELFGYDEGAFTGAKKGGKLGLFELAHNGTIFLDEIGDISPHIQGRLLRVLQEKSIMRVGGDQIVNVNTRIVAATNKNLYRMVQEGQFRNDLYFRLNLLSLIIPPLRARGEDITQLAQYFYAMFTAQYDVPPAPIPEDVLEQLQNYSWPGNVRELQNCMERSVILAGAGDSIDASILESLHALRQTNADSAAHTGADSLLVSIDTMKDMQQQIIDALMLKYEGNKTQVAKILGLSRVTVWKKNK